MCGIFCMINCKKDNQNSSNTNEPYEWKLCKDVITSRGPDCLNNVNEDLTNDIKELWHGYFYASVLWMQGLKPISQPLVDNDCNILLWNGDVFSGDMHQESVCDSQLVLSALQNSSNVPLTLSKIKGPFSIIYYQKSSNLLYFARDKFGRHSLLFKISEDYKSLFLSSVAVKEIEKIVELPAIGIFIVNLNEEKMKLNCVPWFSIDERFMRILNDFKNKFNIDINIVEQDCLFKVERLYNNIVPNSEMGFLKYVDSINNFKSFDEIMEYLLEKEEVMQIINNLLELLNDSVKKRVKTIPSYCRNCTKLNAESISICSHGKIGLLFSGGLDSAILAVIAHKNIDINETIDLINVAFEKKNNSNYEVPDRKTGRQTYYELLKICSGRKFNFIEVNISQEELQKHRSTRISNLVYPHKTILDESLACAVWFASRGIGTVYPTKEFYESNCRVLLLGMGADEQFGGYMRHRTILKREGWSALTKELNFEFDRISERNLGRDDRMVADHGRQSRLPYLDEDVVNFVQKLSPWDRCCPVEKFPPGLGDKLLLRLLARKIQLYEAAKLPKRAFQFGSRIADGKENAKDISERL